jgi:hypothetical protein
MDEDTGRLDDDEAADPCIVCHVPSFSLVKAQLALGELNPLSRFHLKLTLACGSDTLDGADSRYEVHLRQCNVHISTKGCAVDLSNAYSHQLPKNVISADYKRDSSERRQGTSQGSAGGKFKSRFKHLFEIMLGGKVIRKAETKRDETDRVRGTRRIMLISCNGDYWTVGDDEYGDPRNSWGRLRGQYFNEDKKKPLCAIDVRRETRRATVMIQVRARFGHLDIDVLDDSGRPSRTASAEYVSDVGRSLRARLKGIAVAKTIRNWQLQAFPTLPPSEFVLEQQRLFTRMPPNA